MREVLPNGTLSVDEREKPCGIKARPLRKQGRQVCVERYFSCFAQARTSLKKGGFLFYDTREKGLETGVVFFHARR